MFPPAPRFRGLCFPPAILAPAPNLAYLASSFGPDPSLLIPATPAPSPVVVPPVAPLVTGLTPDDLPERVEAWGALDRIVWQAMGTKAGGEAASLD